MSSEIWTPYDGTVGIFLILMWNIIMGNLKSSHLLWRPVEIWQLVSYSKKMLGKETEDFFFCCFVFFYVKLMEPTMAKLELVIDIIDIPESEIKAFSFCILILSFS